MATQASSIDARLMSNNFTRPVTGASTTDMMSTLTTSWGYSPATVSNYYDNSTNMCIDCDIYYYGWYYFGPDLTLPGMPCLNMPPCYTGKNYYWTSDRNLNKHLSYIVLFYLFKIRFSFFFLSQLNQLNPSLTWPPLICAPHRAHLVDAIRPGPFRPSTVPTWTPPFTIWRTFTLSIAAHCYWLVRFSLFSFRLSFLRLFYSFFCCFKIQENHAKMALPLRPATIQDVFSRVRY